MNPTDIASIVEGLTEPTKQIVVTSLKSELAAVICSVNKKLAREKIDKSKIVPPPALILNSLRLCPVEKTRVVLIGQDPYIKPGEAMGLSFSVPRGKTVPPSLRNIYKCLQQCGLINKIPTHGDLTKWANQGVLLLNISLTTEIGKSHAHAGLWDCYTDRLIQEIVKSNPSVMFILLGGSAQSKEHLTNGIVFKWGHPSPMNSANRTDNPKNFKYCDVFLKVNQRLAESHQQPIDWNLDD